MEGKTASKWRLQFCFILLGLGYFPLNCFIYPHKETSDSLYRRTRSSPDITSQLTIPQYLAKHPRIKEFILNELQAKNLPSEYLRIAEEFRILEWYKDWFEIKRPFYALDEEIAKELVEFLIYDSAVALTFQSLAKNGYKKILDLGSGSADYFRALAHLSARFEVILGIEKDPKNIEEAQRMIHNFELDRWGKFIDVVGANMFNLESNPIITAYKPYDLVALLHPNIFLETSYRRLLDIKRLFGKIFQGFLTDEGEIVIILNEIYVPEETSLNSLISAIQKNDPEFLSTYLNYLPYVYALRFSTFSIEPVPETRILPKPNPLQKIDRKFVGTKEDIANFIGILERVERVASLFDVRTALDLFRLTDSERFIGVEILARPDLEEKLWSILSEYKMKRATKEELAQWIKIVLDYSR